MLIANGSEVGSEIRTPFRDVEGILFFYPRTPLRGRSLSLCLVLHSGPASPADIPRISVTMNTEMQRLSRKRQKIALACEECRARKIRCDGRRPRCSACLRKPADQRVCNYPKEHPRASIDRR